MDGAPATVPEVEEATQRIARVPLVLNKRNFNWLTQRITGVVEQPVPDAQQPARAVPATSRTINLVSIVAPLGLWWKLSRETI